MSDPHPLAPLMAEKGAAEALAEGVDCSVAHLRNIRDGRKGASLKLARRLSEATGLPMDTFVQPEAAKSQELEQGAA